MIEQYTRQSLPGEEYRILLGTALCVFNSNNAFIIENILNCDSEGQYDWFSLVDMESGQLTTIIQNTINEKCSEKIEQLFTQIVKKRNRIIHSFQITENGEQVLATKEKKKNGNSQFVITKEYLCDFIRLNDELSNSLHDLRGF